MVKFYFFDLGIRNVTLGNFDDISERWDRESYFENVVFNFLNTREDVKTLQFWRTQSKQEVDFIINDIAAIEVKSKTIIAPKDFKGLRALKEEELIKYYTIVYPGTDERITADGISIVPYNIFIKRLWNGEYIS